MATGSATAARWLAVGALLAAMPATASEVAAAPWQPAADAAADSDQASGPFVADPGVPDLLVAAALPDWTPAMSSLPDTFGPPPGGASTSARPAAAAAAVPPASQGGMLVVILVGALLIGAAAAAAFVVAPGRARRRTR